MTSKFTHLHLHSDRSALDSVIKLGGDATKKIQLEGEKEKLDIFLQSFKAGETSASLAGLNSFNVEASLMSLPELVKPESIVGVSCRIGFCILPEEIKKTAVIKNDSVVMLDGLQNPAVTLQMAVSDWISLYKRTGFELLERCKELGMDSVAVTDHGVVSASIQLYKKATGLGIKPLIGMEAYLSPTDDHTLRQKLEGKPDFYHLTLLAKNATGVQELFELSSRGYTEGFYRKPRVSLPMVESVGKNLIVLGACAQGPVSWNIWKENNDRAERFATRLKEMFPNRFYLEFMDHGLDFQAQINAGLEIISNKFEIPWVPTNDAHFLKREDNHEHSIMMCIQTKQSLEDLTMRYSEECYVKSPEEMIERWGEEACLRTVEIADQVDIQLELNQTFFPEYKEESE